MYIPFCVNPLKDNKISALSILKIAAYELRVTQNIKFVFHRVAMFWEKEKILV